MARPYINAYLNNLQRQVADAAARLKQKQPTKSISGNYDAAEEKFWNLITQVENQPYQLVQSENAYNLLGQGAPADSGYASETYDTVSKVNKESTVAEGLVFKNNQEFDFKV